jgi:hypothetical protein
VAAAVWAASVIFARMVSSAFVLVAGTSFFAKATAFAVLVAIPFTVPFAVTAVWAFPVTVGVAVAVVSFSPASVSVSIPTIASLTVAMVLARGAVTFRVTVMVMRAVCEKGRRKWVSTVLDGCPLVEGAPVDWQRIEGDNGSRS